jgi:parallel beta-helix repeat protein
MFRGILIGVVFSLASLCMVDAATIYVPDDYPTIQDAINASVNGDTVIVRPGTYVENVRFNGKLITLKSEKGPSFTTIDGNQCGCTVLFYRRETSDAILDGFTITNGTGFDYYYLYYGGGIYCDLDASPTIINNVIINNYADYGGGIGCLSNASPEIANNRIDSNKSRVAGGGIYSKTADPMISGNIITGNVADSMGGGICFSGESNTVISDNIVYANLVNFFGAGIAISDESTAVIKDNHIQKNIAGNGGGIFCDYSQMTLTNNIIKANRALRPSSGYGGGVYCFNDTTATFTNNTIWYNSANDGGGVGCTASQITLTNTILWDNSATLGKEITVRSFWGSYGVVNISHSDLQGGTGSVHIESGCSLNWGTGMIDSDPLFSDSTNNDYHLTHSSPCRNTGDNTVITELFDFEGDPRIHDGTVDMGADEFHPHLYHVGTVTPGSPIQVKVVGDPGVNPVTLALGSGIQDPPQSTPYGDLYLVLPPVRTFNLGSIPSTGVLVYPGTVPPSWQAGDEYPFQALLGPLAPGSVLTNLMSLTVE